MSQLSDPIGDFLTRLRNGAAARKSEIDAPYSRVKEEIAKVLQREGYIHGYVVSDSGKFPELRITTKMVNRTSAITGLRRISKPGLRRYVGATDIPRVLGGMGIAILSTPQGIISGRDAKKKNLGGELLATVW